MVAMMGSQGAEKGWRKGPWTHEEDKLLIEYVTFHGEGRWSSVAKLTGLNRSGKSCRLRWVNYLRPGLKKGQLTQLEEGIICELHAVLGNKWSTIASYLPGRTDNEIKNYWRTHFMKRASEKSKQHNKKKKKENRQRKKVQKQLKQEQQLQEEQPHDQEFSPHDDDEGTKNNNETTKSSESQDINREQQVMMGFMHPKMLEQHQYYILPSSMHQEFFSSSTWQDNTRADDDDVLSWFSLWDFDEPLQGFIANKNVVPNQGAPFGGDSMQNNHQGITSPFVGAYDNLCYGKYTFG